MKYVEASKFGGPEALTVVEKEIPTQGDPGGSHETRTAAACVTGRSSKFWGCRTSCPSISRGAPLANRIAWCTQGRSGLWPRRLLASPGVGTLLPLLFSSTCRHFVKY